jgi:hypothetical protein
MNTEPKTETENVKATQPFQENTIKEIQKKFVFKEYYATNKEFRQRHFEKMKQNFRCYCGRFINKYSLAKHKRTNHMPCKWTTLQRAN